jgi:hypothetical protein
MGHSARLTKRVPPAVRLLAIGVALGVAGVALFAARTVAFQAPTCQWVRLALGQDRAQHTLVYLPGNSGVLAFGGADLRQAGSSVKDDLRLLSLGSGAPGTWSELRPSGIQPGPRAEQAAIARLLSLGGGQEMITYGGINTVPSGAGTFTWRSALLGHGSVIGGFDRAYVPAAVQSTTYRLEVTGTAATWSRIEASGAQLRTDHSAIWYPDEDAMIVFGGRQTEEASSADNSTYRLQLSGAPAWERFMGGGEPSRRFAHAAVFDALRKRMLVFGGTNDWTTGMNDVYALDLSRGWANANWSRVSTAGTAPRGRYNHAMAMLPALDWMAVFGGTAGGTNELNDLHALDLSVNPPAWRQLNLSGGPSRLVGSAAAYSASGDMAVFYGGESRGDAKNEAWGLTCSAPVQPTATASPEPTATATLERTATLTPGPPGPLPDLVVTRAEVRMKGYSGGCTPEFAPLVTSVCIANQGGAAAGHFVVRGDGLQWEVESLEAGQSACLPEMVGEARRVTVDADNEVAESDEHNNAADIPQPTPPLLCTPATPEGHKIFLPRADKLSAFHP